MPGAGHRGGRDRSGINHPTTKKGLSRIRLNPLIFLGTPDRIRTCDPLIRSQILYPAELLVHGETLYTAVLSSTQACFLSLPSFSAL